MKKCMRGCRPALPPERAELIENPVKLCHDITRLSRAKAREAAIDGVMSQPGARLVLSLLAVNDGISQRALVDSTHLRPPTVSVILGKMEDEGMVEFYRNPNDKRQTLVHLTEYGKEVDMKGIARIKEIDNLALDGIDGAEYETVMKVLRKMRDNLLLSATDQGKERGE